MSVSKKPMTKRDLRIALASPGVFLKQHLRDDSIQLKEVSEHSGIPYTTLRGYLEGRRPGLSIVTATHLLRYVLYVKGEISSINEGAE